MAAVKHIKIIGYGLDPMDAMRVAEERFTKDYDKYILRNMSMSVSFVPKSCEEHPESDFHYVCCMYVIWEP